MKRLMLAVGLALGALSGCGEQGPADAYLERMAARMDAVSEKLEAIHDEKSADVAAQALIAWHKGRRQWMRVEHQALSLADRAIVRAREADPMRPAFRRFNVALEKLAPYKDVVKRRASDLFPQRS